MLQLIKRYLLQIVADIDNGNSNISREEEEAIIDQIIRFTDKNRKFSKYQACKYLGVSRATFDNLVRDGKLPRGRKQQGFKELFYLESDLRKYKEQL